MNIIAPNALNKRLRFRSQSSLQEHVCRHASEFQFQDPLNCETYLTNAQRVVADGILIQHMYHYYRQGSYRELRRSYIQPLAGSPGTLDKPFKLHQHNFEFYVVILCRRNEKIVSHHLKKSFSAKAFLKTHHDVFSDTLTTRNMRHITPNNKFVKRPTLAKENLNFVKSNHIVIPYVFYKNSDTNQLNAFISSMK